MRRVLSSKSVAVVVGALAAVSCARGGKDPAGGDGGPIDAPCTPQTYYADDDGDGHGDATAPRVACEQPPDTVTISDDCDDASAERFPGNPEVCDAVDNDCDPATVESCPAGCTAQKRPPPDDANTYLFCSNGTSWVSARAICSAAGFRLVQIESAGENSFVRTTANTLLGGVDLHIGGTDAAAEGQWVWDGSDPFWSGGSGGTPIGNRFSIWAPGEPNDDGTEDCAEMKPTGQWNDDSCGSGQRFVCRR